ncbi:mechanosensitive ion channel family protein [Sphingomonas gilva]|uniref:Small-conductance mechanosensitive channel n=1 Tax=Sphingomonas gilva TaxID=2305907 RepID=A0A396RN45_9SPHN|nr:mechanosensitive ion channel family protein [Sphingomonas gilva]RHW17860.1 mechanosensitive ion channel family protein [Sphingomonas gilva]
MSNTAAANTSATARPDLGPQLQVMWNDSAIWFQTHWLQILIAVAVATGIVLLLYFLRRMGVKLCERDPRHTGWPTVFGRAISKTGSFFIIMAAARLVSGYAQPPAVVMTTIEFLWTVAAVFQAAIWARELILGFIEHRTGAEGYRGEALINAMGIIRLLVTVALFAIALIVVLDNLGVNVTGLVAGLGVGGIAIGLAAQGIFADLFAALSIIFDKPFRRGDKVTYDQTTGVIEAIGLKSTRIRAFTGEERIISNKQLLDKEIQNITNRDHIRIQLVIGVAYETPPEKLEALPDMLTGIVEAANATLARASFEAFGASSVDFALWFDIPGNDWPTAHKIRDAVMIEVLRRFAAEKISIPYPTQTTYTAAPDGTIVMPYPEVQPVRRVDKGEDEE